ncbi:MAG TPA: hypothetical protein VN541_00575 [Tepidisphaeraceae bacterium]|nr:hypothetical protein [Tepidisphaeraceae bacterium]
MNHSQTPQRRRVFGFGSAPAVLCAVIGFVAGMARQSGAQVTYSVDTGGVYSGFNNSMGSETEDNFVANSFTVAPGGTHLTDVVYIPTPGQLPANQAATVAIYTGSSLTDPTAGGGLVRIVTSTTSVTLASGQGSYDIHLAQPVDLPVGQVFYVGLLLPGISGSVAPLFEQRFTTPLNHSFFDVGPTLGAPYNLDNTANLTVLGGTHPVVGAGVQSAGNLALRVEALPEPGPLAALTTLALPPILRRNRRRF